MLLRALPALTLLVIAAWSLSSQRCDQSQAPSDSEWDAARQILRDGWQQGDVFRVAPWWADQARAGLFEHTFDTSRVLEVPQLMHHRRLWILADEEHADEALSELPTGYSLVEQWQASERTRVALVAIPDPAGVRFDAFRDLGEASVTRVYPDWIMECAEWRDDGWHCPGGDPWLHVTAQLDELGGTLRRCVYVGVPDTQVRIEWHDTQLGSRLQGDFGNVMSAIRADRGSNVEFGLELDGEVVRALSIDKWDQQVYGFSLDVPDSTAAHTIAVTLRADDFMDRWACFRLWSM